MKVTQVSLKETENSWDYGTFLVIKIDDKTVLSFCDGEPEDNSINRNFNDVLKITNVMKMAYEAGKRGEEFVFEAVEDDEY